MHSAQIGRRSIGDHFGSSYGCRNVICHFSIAVAFGLADKRPHEDAILEMSTYGSNAGKHGTACQPSTAPDAAAKRQTEFRRKTPEAPAPDNATRTGSHRQGKVISQHRRRGFTDRIEKVSRAKVDAACRRRPEKPADGACLR